MRISHILLIFIALCVTSMGNVVMKFEKVICIVHDPRIIENVHCSAKPVNRLSTLISMSGSLKRQLDTLYVNGVLYKKTDYRFQPFLVNVTDNYCDFFSKNRGSVYFRMVAPLFVPYTNLNHSCPYSGEIYIKDLPLDWGKLPTMWPAGEYRLDILMLDQIRRNIGTIRVFVVMKDDLPGPRGSEKTIISSILGNKTFG